MLGFLAALYSFVFVGNKDENGPVLKAMVAVPILSYYGLKGFNRLEEAKLIKIEKEARTEYKRAMQKGRSGSGASGSPKKGRSNKHKRR